MKTFYSSRGQAVIVDGDLLPLKLKQRLPHHFPRATYEIWASALGAAAAAAGTAYAISGAGTPSQPNLASSSRQVSNAEASMLPEQRMLEAASNSGLNAGYGAAGKNLQAQIAKLQSQLSQSGQGGFGSAIIQNQINKLQSQLAKLPTNDFTGNGAGEVQGAIADQNAKNQLALQQKYSPQFITEALKEEALADPQSVAARDRESQLIQQQIQQPIVNPIAPELESQIGARVNAGKGLDEFDTAALNNGVAQALAARGGGGGVGTDFTSPLTTGLAGEQRRVAGIGEAQSFMGSGTTPEDVKYRQDQQNLANLSAEINGQTPTSEFASLSNASRSANPTTNGAPLSTVGNSLQTGGNAALTNYSQQMGQANNWLAGLSATVNASTAVGNAIPKLSGSAQPGT